jgi:hypothetical protein
MKTLFALLFLLSTHVSFAHLQGPEPTAKKKKLKQVITLIIQSKRGNNGVAVAYHPKKKLYYATYGGNEQYPLEIFTAKGKPVHSEALKFDARGLWYNPSCDCFEGNSYNEQGLYSFTVDKQGLPGTRINRPFGQPNEQSAACFNPKTQKVIYFNPETVTFDFYNYNSGKLESSIPLNGLDEEQLEGLNMRLAFTGQKGKELALVNYQKAEIYLFNQSTGSYAQTLELPANAPLKTFFNFDASNGLLWLYDVERKIWYGYK